MGVIRGIFLITISVLFLISLLIGNIFLTLTFSLEYDNVKTELSSVIKDLTIDGGDLKEIIEKNNPSMTVVCQNKSEFVFENEEIPDYNLTIPCETIAQGSEAIIDYSAGQIVDQIYYEEYDCEFLDCLSKTSYPFFLISEKAKNYWKSKFYLSLLASILLIVLIFFLIEKKSSLFIISGSLLILSSLPFMKLDLIFSFFPARPFLEILNVFFTKSYVVFSISFFIGIFVLITGVLLKLFGVGFKISKLFSRKNKTISGGENKQIMKKKLFDFRNKKDKKSK